MSLGTLPGAVAVPALISDLGGERGSFPVDTLNPDPPVARDRQHIAGLPLFQQRAQARVLAVDLISSHPARLHPGVQRGGDHLRGQSWLGGKGGLGRYPGGPATGSVSTLRGEGHLLGTRARQAGRVCEATFILQPYGLRT
jgi:hypothetical protein